MFAAEPGILVNCEVGGYSLACLRSGSRDSPSEKNIPAFRTRVTLENRIPVSPIFFFEGRATNSDYPIGAICRWQLGQAYALTDDARRLKAAYDDFLALWKNADPDVPILKQARSERAALQ